MTMTSIYLAEKFRLKKILTCNHDYKAEVWHNWTVHKKMCLQLGRMWFTEQPSRETSKEEERQEHKQNMDQEEHTGT